MTTLFLYDAPEDLERFLPFSLSRPLGELRYGAFLLRERWSALLDLPAAGSVSPHAHLVDFAEAGAPPVVATPGEKSEPRLLLRSTFAPASGARFPADPADRARFTDAAGATVGFAIPRRVDWPGLAAAAEWPAASVEGKLLAGAWDLVGDLATVLPADLERMRSAQAGGAIPRGTVVLGDPGLVLAAEAAVEPGAVFDVRKGPIFLSPGVEVRSTARLAGPLAVARDARLVGGEVSGSAIGPKCVVRGEISGTVFLGYANKSHDGFVGSSAVGRWVNLGAGTITSNLKNTYGPVRLDLGAERVETGMTFLGTLFGDHVKTAIGTMLPTGAVLGTGANVFGTRRPAGRVHPFAWGTDEAGRITAGRMFLQTASRVLPRRDVAFDAATQAWLSAVYTHATGRPCD